MRDPFAIVARWLPDAHDVLAPPPLVAAACQQIEREDQALAQHYIDWSPEELEGMLQVIDQQRLEFDEEDQRANVRQAVARFIETVVLPEACDPSVWKLPERLRNARQTGTIMYNPAAQKFITLWDDKAGIPLLCPDDAREEAMRVQRRYVPTLVQWRKGGRAVHKLVLTKPNYGRGDLRKGMKEIFDDFRKLLKSGRFPEIKGALCTLEAPLSFHRDWNVHLNVVVMCDGYLCYEKLRRHWFWQVDAYRVRGDTEEGIAKALREIIKYPVQAMPAKSEAHARGGSDAPAMLEWSGAEWLEWWNAHQRFRRTRSYGLLFGIDDPEPESLDGFVSVGFAHREGSRLIRRLTLLDSIPGDKSSEIPWVERYRRAIQRLLGPPDEARQCLDLAKQATEAWQQFHQ